MQTDRTISSNKLDIIVRDNEQGTFVLVDVAIVGAKCDEEASREDSKI